MLRKPRIVVADDSGFMRRLLSSSLEKVGYEVVGVGKDGDEALALCERLRPDAMTLDLAMPGKDGFAAAREISALFPETPIIMCTMHLSPHVETEARKHGIRKVISKTESGAMVPAIRQLLREQQEVVAGQTMAAETISAPALPVPPASTGNSTSPTAPPSADSGSPTPKNVA